MRDLAGCAIDRLALLFDEGRFLGYLVGRGLEDAQLVMDVRERSRRSGGGPRALLRETLARRSMASIFPAVATDRCSMPSMRAVACLCARTASSWTDTEPSDAAGQLANLVADRFRLGAERRELRLQGEESIELIAELKGRRDLGQQLCARAADPLDFGCRAADLTLDALL